MDKEKETSVEVAIRIRPQNAREQVDQCRVCTFVTPNEPQVVLGKDKAFTYDYMYNFGCEQQEIYAGCIERLVEGCFHGFNATVLAYGQTGSGKTYTMGTGFDVTTLPEERGMVPRAVHHLFTGIDNRVGGAEGLSPPPRFTVTAQFMELYNEEIIDLFDSTGDNNKRLKIHESTEGNIYVDGAISIQVNTEAETMEALKRGALSRTVGSTNMNAQSSRSHAIFTIILKQERPIVTETDGVSNDFETLTAKFHFVDLAGSERLKRTGATGDRAKEGISINCGLLALGNVISALGDQTKRGSHIPYRDSKLTRLLQDSLGGNSRTLMIACISPSDSDFMETLNTLKYANRARNIKNKVTVNQDKASAQLTVLRKRLAELESELTEFKAGRLVVSESGSVVLNDMTNENTMLKTENDKLRIRIKSMQGLIDHQNEKLAHLQAQRDFNALKHQDESTGQVMNVNGEEHSHVQELLQQYLQQIEELRAQLVLCESTKKHTRPTTGGSYRSTHITGPLLSNASSMPIEMESDQVLKIARKNIDRLHSTQKDLLPKPRVLRRKKRELEGSQERMSTDVEDWVLKCVTSENDVMAMEGEGSDTEVNEDDDEDNSSSSEDDSISISSDTAEGSSLLEEELESDDDDNRSIATSIVELSTEITIKQQLINQLEKAQKSLNSLRSQYEEKMVLLQNQIRVTEAERDKFIKDITSRQSEHEEAVVKEMKDRFEKQLKGMRTELKQLQAARKEHARALQKNAQQGTELQKLNSDLTDMKKQKFKLMRQLKENASVMKKKDQKREKELAQLRRDFRRKDTIIKTLQADAKRKENIIRKRNEEVTALRKLQQSSQSSVTVENRASARRPKSTSASLSREDEPQAKKAKLHKRQFSMFSSDAAKKKWKLMEKRIKDIVFRSQMVNGFETEMDQWMMKREELSRRADQLKEQREDILQATEDRDFLTTLEEELDALVAQISWANDCIEKLQEEIVDYEDARSEIHTTDTTALIHTCSTKEAKYMLENMVNLAIESCVSSHQREVEAKSLKLRLTTSEQHAELIQIYSSPHAPQSPLVLNSRTVSKITSSFQPRSLPPPPIINLDASYEMTEPNCNNGCASSDGGSNTSLSPSATPKFPKRHTISEESSTKVRRRTGLPGELASHRRQLSDPATLTRLSTEVTSVDHSDHDEGSFKTRRVSMEQINSSSPKRQLSTKKKSVPLITDSLEVPSNTPECPGSPLSGKSTRLGENSVTAGVKQQETMELNKGLIETERLFSARSSKPFICTQTAKGHNGGILSLHTFDSVLLSASQDCTAKVWDLVTGQETAVLTRHHSYVRKVTFDHSSNLVFTACQSLIKLWDLRDLRNAQFVRTLLPSGQGPSHLSSADTVVQDLLVSNDMLYSASGNIVNVWDLKQMSSAVGRLVGHTGTIGTMTSVSDDCIATGSRDRLIKLYDVSDISNSENGFNQISQATLAPAHYDTVSSLAAHNDTMFSACGVSIKQWGIPKRTLLQAIDGAHPQTKNNLITALTHFPPSLLVSACKNGLLKLWHANNCQFISEIIAHKSSINCIVSSGNMLFSGSSDKTIKIWKPNLSSLSNL